jgi:hypothetical protein
VPLNEDTVDTWQLDNSFANHRAELFGESDVLVGDWADKRDGLDGELIRDAFDSVRK